MKVSVGLDTTDFHCIDKKQQQQQQQNTQTTFFCVRQKKETQTVWNNVREVKGDGGELSL